MTDHDEIWLEPDCCADHAGVGRTWCQDDVFECEHGVDATHYIRADIHDDKLTEVALIRLDLEKKVTRLTAEVERYERALRWALGEDPEGTPPFPIVSGPPYYVWRTQLRLLAGLRPDGSSFEPPAADSSQCPESPDGQHEYRDNSGGCFYCSHGLEFDESGQPE